jgi:hypothetical protein
MKTRFLDTVSIGKKHLSSYRGSEWPPFMQPVYPTWLYYPAMHFYRKDGRSVSHRNADIYLQYSNVVTTHKAIIWANFLSVYFYTILFISVSHSCPHKIKILLHIFILPGKAITLNSELYNMNVVR